MLPDADALRVRAATLEHATLEPIQLDTQDGLSPDEAAVLAVLLNPSLRAARDERMLGDAQLLQAGLLPNPELAFDFATPTGGDTSGTANAFGLGLTWNAASLIHRSAGVRKARARRAATAMDVAWQEWQAAQSAKAAVLRLVSLNEQISAARRARPELQKLAEDYRTALAAGRVDILTYYAAWSEAMDNRMNLIVLQGRLAEAIVGLESATGIYRIAPPGEGQIPAPAEPRQMQR